MTAVEDFTAEPVNDEPPEGWKGDPLEYAQGRAALFGEEVSRLHRIVDDAVALLHELGAHEEADRIDGLANPW